MKHTPLHIHMEGCNTFCTCNGRGIPIALTYAPVPGCLEVRGSGAERERDVST